MKSILIKIFFGFCTVVFMNACNNYKHQNIFIQNINKNSNLEFLDKIVSKDIDIAAEYLVMGAWLAFLKSKLLLPIENNDNLENYISESSKPKKAINI